MWQGVRCRTGCGRGCHTLATACAFRASTVVHVRPAGPNVVLGRRGAAREGIVPLRLLRGPCGGGTDANAMRPLSALFLGGGGGEGEVGAGTSHCDALDPHPALRAALSLEGRGVCSSLRWQRSVPFLHGSSERRLLSLALARARERMKGEGVGRTWAHDALDPHPALRADLSLEGRGVLFFLRGKMQRLSFTTHPGNETPLRPLLGAERARVRWGLRTSHCDVLDPHPALRADLSLEGRGVSSFFSASFGGRRGVGTGPTRPSYL